MRTQTLLMFGVEHRYIGIVFWPASPWFWQFTPRRWVRSYDHFLPKYLRVDIPGASMETLRQRAKYRGGRKARRAERRLRQWTQGAYFSDLMSAILIGGMGTLAAMTWLNQPRAA